MDSETLHSCFFCNGYYGPSFDQAVCATCHDFIFPNDPTHTEKCKNPLVEYFADDSDSGNDEPNDIASPPFPAPPQQPIQEINALQKRIAMLTEPKKSVDNFSSILIDNLPPELLYLVFSFLDDISLWSVANVCRTWRGLIESQVSQVKWKNFTSHRFPLYKPLVLIENWFKVYSNFMESSPCYICLGNMRCKDLPHCEENRWRSNRLQGEARYVTTESPEGIFAVPLDLKFFRWQATIHGPKGSPYQGGIFFLYLQVPYNYPITPPMVRFITKIFHPNISRHGDVGIDAIQHNWSLVLTISKVLLSIQSLLTDPYCAVCMEPEIGELYHRDREKFNKIARAWTWKYAMQDVFLS